MRGGARSSAIASSKRTLRGLTQSVARKFQPAGVRVRHTILDGIIETARSRDVHSLDPANMMKTKDFAETYYNWRINPILPGRVSWICAPRPKDSE